MEPLTAREQRKLQDEIARQEKQERVAGQQRLVREGQLQRQQRVHAAAHQPNSLHIRTCMHFQTLCFVLQRQQEMLQHQQTQAHWLSQLKPAPTFYPTEAEFEDPISYIRSIQTEGSKHGETRTWFHLVLRSTNVCSQQPACLAQVYAKLFLQSSRLYQAAW